MDRPAAEGAGGANAAGGGACGACGAPGAIQRCAGCLQAVYCDAACQRLHWRGGHKRECRAAAAAVSAAVAGGGGAAARTPTAPAVPAGLGGPPHEGLDSTAVGCGGATAEDDEADPVNPCPLCLGNEDDSGDCGACFACGQLYCGECNVPELVGKLDLCPTCRAPVRVSDEENFKRLWSLVHDRTLGRHTPVAQDNLGGLYEGGKGVGQDHAAAARWYRKAAEQGQARAQYNLGILCEDCNGVAQDHGEAARWYRKAAEQGFAPAQLNLGLLYARGLGTPPDLRQAAEWWRKAAAQGDAKASGNLQIMLQWALDTPGMPVVVTGLTASPQFNGRAGLVQGPAPKPGRLAVLLDGDSKPTSLREANLVKADGV